MPEPSQAEPDATPTPCILCGGTRTLWGKPCRGCGPDATPMPAPAPAPAEECRPTMAECGSARLAGFELRWCSLHKKPLAECELAALDRRLGNRELAVQLIEALRDSPLVKDMRAAKQRRIEEERRRKDPESLIRRRRKAP